ncbi:MAG: SGNH/GDSL hydrolase family protein [Kofleriaceae bacterium]
MISHLTHVDLLPADRTAPARRGRRERLVGCVGLAWLGAALVACTSGVEATPDAAGADAEATAPAVVDEPTDPPCLAQAFGEPGFAGDGACLPLGVSSLTDLTTLGLTQGVIGSLVVDPGYRVTVWSDDAAPLFQTAATDAAVALSGQITRLEVTPCLAGLFEGADGHGAGACVDAGLHDAASLADLGLRAGQPGSVVVAPGYRATVTYAAGAPSTTVVARGTLALPTDGDAVVAIDVALDDEPAAAPIAAALAKDLTSFAHIYVLGDSLSDQQNQRSSAVPRCPNQHLGYWNGRFTNGYNWVDYLTQDNPSAGAKIINKAVGGSKVLVNAIARPSLMTQATTLIAALPSSTRRAQLANSLVVIWGGANDVKETALSRSPGDAVTFGNSIVTQLKAVVTTLKNAGVQHVVFIGVPYIERVPVASGWTTAQRSWTHNTVYTVNTNLGDYARTNGYPFATVPAMINDWLDHNLTSVNMTDTTNACATMGACDFTVSGTYVEKLCTKKMFFDPLHPTSGAHCGVAKRIELTLATKYNTVYGYSASIESCARREQAAAFSGAPARRIRFDIQRATLTQSLANAACPTLCTGASAHWNGNWTNLALANPVSQGGTHAVGVCGCDR